MVITSTQSRSLRPLWVPDIWDLRLEYSHTQWNAHISLISGPLEVVYSIDKSMKFTLNCFSCVKFEIAHLIPNGFYTKGSIKLLRATAKQIIVQFMLFLSYTKIWWNNQYKVNNFLTIFFKLFLIWYFISNSN